MNLKNFFMSISKNLKLDPDRLMAAMKGVFHNQAEYLFPIVKKALGSFRLETDFRSYCAAVSRFISSDIKAVKDIYFQILDLNKDKRICETDLFKMTLQVQTVEMSEAMTDDVVLLLKVLENKRIQEEKHDEIALLRNRINANANSALLNRRTSTKLDNIKEIGKFLSEVKRHQERLKRQQILSSNNFEAIAALKKQMNEEDDSDVDEVIPLAMRPFLNKEINFDLFLQMLTERVDQQRTYIYPK